MISSLHVSLVSSAVHVLHSQYSLSCKTSLKLLLLLLCSTELPAAPCSSCSQQQLWIRGHALQMQASSLLNGKRCRRERPESVQPQSPRRAAAAAAAAGFSHLEQLHQLLLSPRGCLCSRGGSRSSVELKVKISLRPFPDASLSLLSLSYPSFLRRNKYQYQCRRGAGERGEAGAEVSS